MNPVAVPDDHLAEEDEPSADALSKTLSLADTPEEDADRYREVIRELEEFEESGEGSGAEEISASGGTHELGIEPETKVA